MNNTYKIGDEIICLTASENIEDISCSIILLVNFIHNHTVNNIRIPNTILIHTSLRGDINLNHYNYG